MLYVAIYAETDCRMRRSAAQRISSAKPSDGSNDGTDRRTVAIGQNQVVLGAFSLSLTNAFRLLYALRFGIQRPILVFKDLEQVFAQTAH